MPEPTPLPESPQRAAPETTSNNTTLPPNMKRRLLRWGLKLSLVPGLLAWLLIPPHRLALAWGLGFLVFQLNHVEGRTPDLPALWGALAGAGALVLIAWLDKRLWKLWPGRIAWIVASGLLCPLSGYVAGYAWNLLFAQGGAAPSALPWLGWSAGVLALALAKAGIDWKRYEDLTPWQAIRRP